MRGLIGIAPFLIVPVLIYNITVWMVGGPLAGEDVSNLMPIATVLDKQLFAMPMLSGVVWRFSFGDLIVLVAVLSLLLEVIKSTGTGTGTLINHALSMGVFIFCFTEFLIFKSFATSEFFFIMMMALFDILAGFVITIVSARRDFGVGQGLTGG